MKHYNIMKRYLLLMVWFIGMQINAQDLMRITSQDGTQYELSINNIKEMNFYTPAQIDVVGEWLAVVGGGMVCFDIQGDGNLARTSFNPTLGLFYKQEGTYTLKDNVLTLNYEGTTQVITIANLTDTQMVSTYGDVYYKVLEPTYVMTTGDAPISVGNEGDVVKYADNCIVEIENNKIKAKTDGTGYALVEENATGLLKAYRIDVQLAINIVDWTQYFKKSRTEIEEVFGTPQQSNDEKHTISYTTGYDAAIWALIFEFSENYSEVIAVHVIFYDDKKREVYCNYISNNYIYNKTSSLGTAYYYDTEDPNLASVKITVSNDPDLSSIVYKDLKSTPTSVVDWTRYFKKSGEQIKAEFGNDPSITDDDEDEDYSYMYTQNIGDLKRLTFYFNKGFEKVTSIRISFKDASSMQNYCDAIAGKYILYSETETRKTYYNTDKASTASVRVVIQSSGSTNYITYTDMSE